MDTEVEQVACIEFTRLCFALFLPWCCTSTSISFKIQLKEGSFALRVNDLLGQVKITEKIKTVNLLVMII